MTISVFAFFISNTLVDTSDRVLNKEDLIKTPCVCVSLRHRVEPATSKRVDTFTVSTAPTCVHECSGSRCVFAEPFYTVDHTGQAWVETEAKKKKLMNLHEPQLLVEGDET